MSRRQVRGAVDSAGPQELQSEHFGIVNPALEGQRRRLGDLEPDRFPVLLWIIEVRSLTRPAAKTSRTLRPTRSQPRNLLSTAMLNSARSRALPAISRRTRMDQTCRGSSGRFWPMMRPLFQGARTGRRTGRKSTNMGLPPVRRADPSSVMPTTTGYHVSGREGERRADSGPLQHNAYTCILLPWPRLEDADRSPIGPIRPLLRMRPNGLECRNDLGNC